MRKRNRELEITTFVITNKNIELNHINGKKALAKKVLIGRHMSPRELFTGHILDLSNTRKIEIYINRFFKTEKIQLPNEIHDKLIRYFKHELYRLEGFDCSAFVHYLCSVPFSLKYGIDLSNWETFICKSENDLKIGDVVVMGSWKTRKCSNEKSTLVMKHFAMYVGYGLYISKYGNIGSIYFSTLESMKNAYESEVVCHMYPIKKNNKSK